MKGIYRFKYETRSGYGRLDGLFIIDSSEIEKYKDFPYFAYEKMGKYTEEEIILNEKVLQLISNDPRVLEMFEELKLETGFNPFKEIDPETYKDWLEEKNYE